MSTWNEERIAELKLERDEAIKQRDSYFSAMRTEYQDLVRERDELRKLLGIANEYDKTGDDAAWEAPHPIFLMAQEIDTLKARNAELQRERDSALEEIKQLNKDWRELWDKYVAKSQAIEDAPHEDWCGEMQRNDDCNCWKSEVTE